jgi:predicted chitinase
MQLTHRANYAAAGRALGYDYVSNPDVSKYELKISQIT